MTPLFVAEVKHRNPFTGWRSDLNWWQLMDLATEHGDIVSVHTSRDFGGGWEFLRAARTMTEKPILAKGAHPYGFEVDRAFDLGADYVLTVNPDIGILNRDVWYEPLTWAWPATTPQRAPDTVVVVNERRLDDGERRGPSLVPAVRRALTGFRVVQASCIAHPDDVDPEAWAFIVGTNLVQFCRHL